MKKFLVVQMILLLIIFKGYSKPIELSDSTLLLLEQLDEKVANKKNYTDIVRRDIAHIKHQFKHTTGSFRLACLQHLISDYYVNMQSDTALIYIAQLDSLARPLLDTTLRAYIACNRARVYAVKGMYVEAIEQMRKVSHRGWSNSERLLYYRTMHTIYGWMVNYSNGSLHSQRYRKLKCAYRDSVLLLEPQGIGRDIVLADAAVDANRPEEALKLLKKNKSTERLLRAFTYFTKAECYRMLGDIDKCTAALAQTAIVDIERGVKEYQALPTLALVLHELGYIERSYNYLICSLEDAEYCGARLRSLQATKIFPIVDHNFRQLQQRRRMVLHALLVVVGIFAIVLVVSIVQLRRQMRKRAEVRKELAVVNEKLMRSNNNLSTLNQHLREESEKLLLTDKVKDEYIARYLNRCREQIDTLDGYRRDLLHLAREGNLRKLESELKSKETILREQHIFYEDFDHAFLTLFPDFVTSFNALLPQDYRVVPKIDGQLTTELRMFALIRLGVTDTPRIAHFLNYSLATIYNYRSRFRNKALCPNEEFEERVMAIR